MTKARSRRAVALKNSQIGRQNVKNDPQMMSKLKVRIEGTKEK